MKNKWKFLSFSLVILAVIAVSLQLTGGEALAEEAGLDLVEVAPNADPPVCRVMNYDKFRYEQKKKSQEAKKKQSAVQIKEIKFRPGTDIGD